MPNRIIKESCRTSPTLAALSDAAERLFYRLTTAADDYGRFERDAEIIKGNCLPRVKWPISKVEACLSELGICAAGEDEPLAIYYQVKGRIYGQFTKWEEHQRKRESKPKFPGPEDGEILNTPNKNHTAAICGESRQVAAYPRDENERRETRTRDVSRAASPSAALEALEVFTWQEVEEWTMSEGVERDAAREEFHDFKDYWRGCGARNKKGYVKDWPATWRRRIRDLKKASRIKLTPKPRPALVIDKTERKDPPTEQAKGILSRLLPTVAGNLEGSPS